MLLDTVAYFSLDKVTSEIQFYYEAPDESDGPDFESKAVLRVDDYFFTLKVGLDPIIEIRDLVGSRADNEMSINTGCLTDAGCEDKNLVFRFFKNAPFTVTTFHTSMGGFYTGEHWTGNLNRTTVNEIRKKGGMIYLFSGGYENNRCYLDFRTIYPSGKGLKKGEQIVKRKVECAG